MKKSMSSIALLAMFFLAFSAFKNNEKAVAPDVIMADFMYTVENAELEARFELQFPDLFKDVTSVAVHKNDGDIYYYTVYGTAADGGETVDYFKTTEAEVASKIYNFIEMTANTMAFGAPKCREAVTWPPPSGSWCHPNNPGWVCGVQTNYGRCIYY